MQHYIGNGAYCYANCTSMLLAAAGEKVASGTIEVLTGVGLGAVIDGGDFLFFHNQATAPDTGVTRALDVLGFEYVELAHDEDDAPPWEKLRRDLEQCPVVLGPLDMGHLRYIPYYETLGGSDHYVLAYGMEGDEVLLHDPAGYPHVSLELDWLEKAWRAECVPYRRGAFRSWTRPQRVASPTEEQVYAQTMDFFQGLYRDSRVLASQNGEPFAGEAIAQFAERVKGGDVSPQVAGHFVYFAFPLGARRALDFAAFFAGRDERLAELKRQQAEIFGQCQTWAVRKDWLKAAESMHRLAEVETEFEQALAGR